MELAAPFGTVEKVVMLTSKNQALLEFADIAAAISMSNFYLRYPTLLPTLCAISRKYGILSIQDTRYLQQP